MDANQYNDFLKNHRRTVKFFTDDPLPAEHRQMLIDVANAAPAQNGTRNFIPVLLEKPEHKEWFQKNIFYMAPKYDTGLKREMPKEYQMGASTAPFVLIYLAAGRNLPITTDMTSRDSNGSVILESDKGNQSIMRINIGLNMGLVSSQAYLLGYDVGFVGCTRGLDTVEDTPELMEELLAIYQEFGLLDLNSKHNLYVCYALCIGRAESMPGDHQNPANVAGAPVFDGYYNNIKKHKLKNIENVRTCK